MRFLFFLALTLFSVSKANANEPLRFGEAGNYKENQILTHAQANIENPDLILSPFDLNGDFIDEYVVRTKNKEKSLYSYAILAFENNTPIIIGKFKAFNLLVSPKKSYGINNIIVYNDLNNDFRTFTSVWNPYEFSYSAPY